jgi:hypothetical protein
MKCQICNGEGGWTEVIDREIGGPYYPCQTCNKTGTISLWTWIYIWFWDNAPVWFVEWYSDLRWGY